MALFWILFGCVFSAAMIGAGAALAFVERRRSAEMIRRLRRGIAGQNAPAVSADILAAQPSPGGGAGSGRLAWLQKQLLIAGLDWNARSVALAMAACAAAGACVGCFWRLLVYPVPSAAGLAVAAATIPLLYVRRKARKRMAAFEAAFPDALEFFARAIRAGHALSVGLEMVAGECGPPLKREFTRVRTEQNLGWPLEKALCGFAERVPLVDVRFFVSAVLLQRETGGNLGEILDNLSQVMRDRFELKGKVLAASSHGRMTARALTIIPLVLMGLLSALSPGYLQRLTADPDGRLMLLGSATGQVIGYLCMKKITNIQV